MTYLPHDFLLSEEDGDNLLLPDFSDNGSLALHWIDQHGYIKWANQAELDLFGYSESEYIGKHISEFHTDKTRITDILNKLKADEILRGVTSEVRCKDGSIKVVGMHSSVLKKDGEFVHACCYTIDVTEQNNLLEELKASRDQYFRLLNNLPAAVYTCDASGRIIYFNELAVRLWGYRPQLPDDSLLFCACHNVWTPEGERLPREETLMARAIKTGTSFRDVELVIERPDGSTLPVRVNIDVTVDRNQQVTGAINIFQDITAVKQAELALKQRESYYQHLIEHLPAAMYTTDAQGKITLYNKAAARLWGREPKIGEDLWCGSWKILNPDGSDLPVDECPMAICLKQERPVFGEEIIIVRPDGVKRHIAPYPQPIFDAAGKMTGAFNMLFDITDAKHTERAMRESEHRYRLLASSLERKVEERTRELMLKNEELQKSEERYHKMVEGVEDYAILLLDPDGFIQNWNEGARKIKGYTEPEVLGKSFRIFYLSEDREKGLPEKLINTARQEGKALHEGWRVRKDGTRFWGSIVITALFDHDRRLMGFSKVTRDLTEKKLTEDKIKAYASELEFQNKELEQFAYAASHDLKEPLRKIQFYNSYVIENYQSALGDKGCEYLQRSVNASKRMQKLINDILSYSKAVPSGEKWEKVDLTEIVEEVALLHREEAAGTKIAVSVAPLPVVHGISFQLSQVFDNLISNAIKYRHPDREICIQVTSRKVKGTEIPDENVNTRKSYYCITVTDNGIGFDQKYADKIFEMFQRLHTKPESTGSGIGLAICKKIVQNHHGFIFAHGVVNQGASIEVHLPVGKSADTPI